MIVGEDSREDDMNVNITKEKKQQHVQPHPV
jgi:predicted membrane GTPase involved in stress response